MSGLITILLVEDDQLFGETLQKVLCQHGFKVLRACNGLEALRIYNPQDIHLVITDMIMPGLEGVELIIRLKRIHRDVKIIAMSGGGKNCAQAYLDIVRPMGVTHSLIKPFGCDELLAAIRKLTGMGDNICAARKEVL